MALVGVEVDALGALGWWDGASFPGPALGLFGVAFGAYAAGTLLVHRLGVDERLLWGVAITLRVVLLPLAPELSDDVYRYLWDGHVQLSGINPYLHAPAADVTRPVGEFNEVRMLVRDGHVEHWLNGKKLLEYDLGSEDWKRRVAT